jgi:hypothetical protein
MEPQTILYVDWHTALITTLQQGFAQLTATICQEGRRMSAALDALTTEVQRTNGVMQSALTLIEGISVQLAEAGTDQAKLDALRTDLEENAAALAAAVTANQPAEPTP